MTSFAVCCSMYEHGRPFLPQWIAATAAACAGTAAEVVIASDGLANGAQALAGLADSLPVALTEVRSGSTLAEVRTAMLRRAMQTNRDFLIFIDMDDMLLPDSLRLHASALADADFSYGDLWLTDEAGVRTGERFFANSGVPSSVADYRCVLTRNFLGLSNTAVRRSRLDRKICTPPPHLLAVDWWIFTHILMRHRRGQITAAPVAEYRTYGGNLVGGRPGTEMLAVLRRCAIVRDHYRALPQTGPITDRLAKLEALISRLEQGVSPRVAQRVAEICSQQGVWWEDIGLLVEEFELRTGTVPQSGETIANE